MLFISSVKKNKKFVVYNLVAYAIIVFNIISSLYAVRENLSLLHKDLYSVWVLIFATINILGIFHFGFNSVAIFKYNEYKKDNNLTTFFSSNFAIAFYQSLIVCCVVVVLYNFSHVIISDSKYVPVFNNLLLLALPGVIFSAFSSYLEAILYYNFKFVFHRNILELLRIGILNLMFVVGLNCYEDVRILPIIYSIVALISFSYTLYKYLNQEKITLKLSKVESSYVVKNMHDGFSFWILSVSSYVITQTDVFFISMIKSDISLVTMYSQSFRLQDIVLKFIKKIAEIKAPKTLSLYNSGNHSAVVDIYKKLLKINLLLSTIAFLGISFLGKYVLEIWLNKTIIFDQTLIVVLSLICITGSIHWVLWNFCNLTGLQKKVRNIVVIEILSNLILSYILLKNFGLVGLGIASIISNSITIIYIYSLFAKYTRNHLGEPTNMIEN